MIWKIAKIWTTLFPWYHQGITRVLLRRQAFFLQTPGSILIVFGWFRAIVMVLAVWAKFCKSKWFRIHPKILSGYRCLFFWYTTICAITFLSTLPQGREKVVGGGVKKSLIFSLGDDTIPGDGQVQKFSLTLPPPFFPPVKISKILKMLDTRKKNVKISENAKYTSKNCCRT